MTEEFNEEEREWLRQQMFTQKQLMNNPLNQYRQLPDYVRAFLEGLRPEELARLKDVLQLDVKEVKEVMELIDRSKTIGWFFKWLIITFMTAFGGMMAFGDQISKLFSMIRGDRL